MNELQSWTGEYDIIITYKDGNEERQHVKNRIMNDGINMIRDALNGEVSDLEIKYLALGTSDAVNLNTLSELGNEQFRTEFISTTKPATGFLEKTAIVLDNEAVFNIREIGIFAGADATQTADTGVMVSRILWSRDKTELESIQFVRRDRIRR